LESEYDKCLWKGSLAGPIPITAVKPSAYFGHKIQNRQKKET
jgi:hypothetical protein